MTSEQLDNHAWISVNKGLPHDNETVFISNGKGWTSIGCLIYDEGYHWAEIDGEIYQEGDKIVAECVPDDLDVQYWHKLPLAINRSEIELIREEVK